MTVHIAQLDGRAASAAELAPLAFAGYAHFTAAQVRGGEIRGLDLHLNRLREASAELFGRALPDDRVRDLLRAGLAASPADVSLTATVFSRPGEFVATDADLSVLVRTGPPASGPSGPLALAVVEYERALAGVKHVGEVGKTYYLRRAVQQGFDDAAFVDRAGRFSEASIWNLAFWDGDSVVWPRAEALPGTMMGMVRRQLDRLGVSQRTEEIAVPDLPDLAGAVVMNSWTPAVPVHRIGAAALPSAPEFAALLRRAHAQEPLVAP
ncbi:aminotransferase class IV family protein [Nocardia sp. NPDC001965]